MAKEKQKEKGGSNMTFALVGFGAIFTLFILAPGGALIATVGLLPTLVYWLVDSHMYRAVRLRTIFLFNMAGVAPFVVQGWGDLTVGLRILIEGVAPMAMLGAGALGILALKVAPACAAFVIQVADSERTRKVQKQQKQLHEIWGDEIVGDNSKFFEETGTARAPTEKSANTKS